MENTAIQNQQQGEIYRSEVPPEVIEKLVLYGDLSGMQPQEKTTYYNGICKSLGLNPLTQPFAITKLNGKEIMYAKKDATEQLRRIYGVSVTELIKEQIGDIYMVTAKGVNSIGRVDSSIGAVSLTGKIGEALANQIMKAETKAKRRLTLSICGLGMLDETEIEDATKVTQASPSPDQASPYQSIDVIDHNDPEVLAKYEQMLGAVMHPNIPDAQFGDQTREEFINDFRSELMSGTMPITKGENIYNILLGYFAQ